MNGSSRPRRRRKPRRVVQLDLAWARNFAATSSIESHGPRVGDDIRGSQSSLDAWWRVGPSPTPGSQVSRGDHLAGKTARTAEIHPGGRNRASRCNFPGGFRVLRGL
jgi:hypothetical protein